MIQEELPHWQTVYRCHGCRCTLIDADMFPHGSCTMCGGRRYSPATLISDDEMKALIGRGYRYIEEDWTFVEDRLIAERKMPGLDVLLRQVA